MSYASSRVLSTLTVGIRTYTGSPKCGKQRDKESKGKTQGGVAEGCHDISGVSDGLTTRHDGGLPVKGDLWKKPGMV